MRAVLHVGRASWQRIASHHLCGFPASGVLRGECLPIRGPFVEWVWGVKGVIAQEGIGASVVAVSTCMTEHVGPGGRTATHKHRGVSGCLYFFLYGKIDLVNDSGREVS